MCNREKPFEQFGKSKSAHDGLAVYCKECSHIKRIANKEQTREYNKSRRPTIAEQENAKSRERYEANKEKVTARQRAYGKANPLKRMQNTRRYQVRKKNASVEKVSYEHILERDGHYCYICCSSIHPSKISFDHVIPIIRGGTHSEDNIRVAHIVCNSRKGTRLLEEMTSHQRRGVE